LMRAMRQKRRRAWRLRLRILAPPVCAAALALTAGAAAHAQTYTDLRSPDTRDAAQAAQAEAEAPASEPVVPTVVETGDDDSHTLPIILSSIALVVALAGVGVALSGLHRPPRPRWTAR
jgi:anthranilate phosphoribosyltransferase